MNFLKPFLLIAMAATMTLATGCETLKENAKAKVCDEYNKALDKGSLSIAAALECEDPTAVRADLEKHLSKLKLCEDKQKEFSLTADRPQPIADAVCPLVAKFATNYAKDQLPKKWDCKADAAGERLHETIDKACHGLVNL